MHSADLHEKIKGVFEKKTLYKAKLYEQPFTINIKIIRYA